MARQNINIGAAANDGTGDTLRAAGTKINSTFTELYTKLGDGDNLSSQITLEDSAIVFEGGTDDDFETRLVASNVTSDIIIQLPNISGVISSVSSVETLTNKTLQTPTINSPVINTGIRDNNDNNLINLTPTPNAVNEITIVNAISNSGPQINATGTNTNVQLNLNGKQEGTVNLSKLSLGFSEIATTGTASNNASYIICTTTSGSINVALNDGSTHGEIKIFTCKGGNTATVTPDNFAQGTSFELDNNEGATCIWDGSNWFLIGNQNITTVV